MSEKRDCTHYYTRHEVHWEDFLLDLRKCVSGQRFKHRETYIEQTRIYTSIFIQLKCSIIKNIFGETDQRHKMAVYFQPQYEGAVLVCNEKKLKNTLLPDTCTQT
jgi:hypothetical protein